MNNIYNKLYNVYIKELHKLNIGYAMDNSTIKYMFDLINAIDYVDNGMPSTTEIYKIITYYE